MSPVLSSSPRCLTSVEAFVVCIDELLRPVSKAEMSGEWVIDRMMEKKITGASCREELSPKPREHCVLGRPLEKTPGRTDKSSWRNPSIAQ